MHKEDVDYTDYEDDLVKQININCQYGCLSTTNKRVQPASFKHNVLLLRCQKK